MLMFADVLIFLNTWMQDYCSNRLTKTGIFELIDEIEVKVHSHVKFLVEKLKCEIKVIS